MRWHNLILVSMENVYVRYFICSLYESYHAILLYRLYNMKADFFCPV